MRCYQNFKKSFSKSEILQKLVETLSRDLFFSGFDFSNFFCKVSKSLLFLFIWIVLIYVLDLRNLQEQVRKAFCFKNYICWHFTVRINCSMYWDNKQHGQARSDRCKISTDGVPISSNHPSILNLVSLTPEDSECT